MNWRNQIDPTIKDHVEARVRQSAENREAILEASNPREAQLWIALGHLSKELTDANMKLRYMEKVLADTLKAKKKKTRSKKEQKKIDDLVKTLSRL
jgi:uncharacterized protein (DUF2225 family)